MSTFNMKWRNFQSNTVKKLARGFLTGGEPFVTEYLLFCFQSWKYKTKFWGLVKNLPNDKSPNMKWRIFQIINTVKTSASSSVRHLSAIRWSSLLSSSVVISSPCSSEVLPRVPLSVDRSEDVDSLQEYSISWFLSIKKINKNLLLH